MTSLVYNLTSFKTKYFEIVSQDQKRLYLTCFMQCTMQQVLFCPI